MKKTLTSFTEKGDERIGNLCDSLCEELTPDNTVGDFLSELLIRVATEILGEDVMNTTLGELERDSDKQMAVLEQLFKSDLIDIFGKIDNPTELMA